MTHVLVVLLAVITPQQTIAGLVGTWNCVTHDAQHRTWQASATDTLYGPWLRLDARAPAQHGQAASTAVKFLGYDADSRRWTITSIGDDGEYYVLSSTSPQFDGSQWTDAYPADNGTKSIHVQNANQYTFDSANPDGHGHVVRAHTVCVRG
jgi:hypothetical protein